MPKLDYVQKFKEILESSGKSTGTSDVASTLFMTMHQLFPRAVWSEEIPALVDKNFAGWWDTQFSGVSKLLSDTTKKAAALYRYNIGQRLTEISTRASNNVLPTAWKGAAANLANELSGLAAAIRGDMPSRDKIAKDLNSPWASFQNASASVLLRVCAGVVSPVDSSNPKAAALNRDRIEATLKLAEETQRLLEIVGDPPDDLKIGENEGAGEYLKAVIPDKFLGEEDGPGKQISDEVLQILQNREKDPSNPQHLKDLASRVEELRGVLITQGVIHNTVDEALAARSILIAEAMTPEYGSKTGTSQDRPPITARQSQELKNRVDDEKFGERLSEEVNEEKGVAPEREKK
jgi:hypothetical protein